MVSREEMSQPENMGQDVTLNTEAVNEQAAVVEKPEEVQEVENEKQEVEQPEASAEPVQEPEAVKAEPETPEEPKEAEPEVKEPEVEAEPEVKEPEPEPEPEVKEPEAEPEPEAKEPEPEPEPEAKEPEAVEAVDEQPEPAAQEKPDYAAMDKHELVEALKELAKQSIDTVKDDVLNIKSAFFALRNKELEQAKQKWVEDGNEEAAFVADYDEDENTLKELLNCVKEKRAEFNAAQDAIRAENLQKKNDIIAQINSIAEDPDNVNRHYAKVQQLQQEFKAVGEVPASSTTEVWKSFQLSIEKFYDVLKMNKDLRDLDFKKNLEIKQQLCADAEALDEQEDVVVAFKKLQELHDRWRETGPVAKEIREELWTRFKNASSVINKKHQSFFEGQKAKEKENAEAKTALCEQIEAMSTEGLNTYAAWDEATKQIIDLQEQWKKLGFASRKLNNELFARFRKSCDEFFAQKAAFFKDMKEGMAANLAKKIELCEKAEAMKDSTEWKKTTDAYVELQKEWKTIGPVVKKHSDAVWKRFIAACDYFFEQKKKQTTSIHTVEHENLKAKKAVIAELKTLLAAEEEDPDAATKVRELMANWQSIGHVPYKEKDKIYADYKELIDKAYDRYDMKAARAQLANFETTISQSSSDKVFHERERLVRTYEQKCAELKTYENNLGFFSARSKAGNSLVKEMEKKMVKIKEDIALLEQKIKVIDEKI